MPARLTLLSILAAGYAFASSAGDAMCRAAENGDLASLKRLAAAAGVDARGRDGSTALICAASVRQRKRNAGPVVQFLLDRGANVNARDHSGRTPLLASLENSATEYKVIGGDDAMARLLISHGANVNAQDRQGWSALMKVTAEWADQPELMAFLVARGAEVNARMRDGQTALMLAVHIDKADRVRFLLDHGAEVNQQDASGRTALMIAASDAIVQLLLARNPNLNLKDQDGLTAADHAARAGALDRATLLLDRGTQIADREMFLMRARNYALLHQIAAGDPDRAKALLAQGADPNFRAPDGRTLLMIAADNRYSAVKVKVLLDAGADVNASNNRMTPLMVAADQYVAESVAALLGQGADPKAADENGRTVLMHAAASKHSYQEASAPLIGLLIEHGADVNARDDHEETALDIAIRMHHDATAEALRRAGAKTGQ